MTTRQERANAARAAANAAWEAAEVPELSIAEADALAEIALAADAIADAAEAACRS